MYTRVLLACPLLGGLVQTSFGVSFIGGFTVIINFIDTTHDYTCMTPHVRTGNNQIASGMLVK